MAEAIARTVTFDAEGDEGPAQGIAGRIVAGAEAQHAGEQVTVAFARGAGEQLEEAPPGVAVLDGAVLGIFLFGVFGRGLENEAAEPALQEEGGKVEGVFLLFREGGSVFEVLHEGKAGGIFEF